MNVKAQGIKDFTKELYLTPNEYGNHRYSLRQISQQISQQFHKKT